MKENIGANAGRIWNYLEAHGESKLYHVKKELKLNSENSYLALGWLAREGKIDFYKKGLSVYLKLI